MTRRYAAETSVSTDASISEIRALVRRYGATEFGHMESEMRAQIVFTMNARRIMFRLEMPDRAGQEFWQTNHAKPQKRTLEAATLAWEQSCRSLYRALALIVKAKLEAVAIGIVEFESEFLGNIVMPGTGITVGEAIKPQLALSYKTGSIPPLLEGPRP